MEKKYVSKSKTRNMLVDKIVDSLSEDRLPWQQPWVSMMPRNGVSKKQYRGVNALLLSLIAYDRGYEDPRWVTFNQAKEKGWKITGKNIGVPIEYWSRLLVTQDKEGNILDEDDQYNRWFVKNYVVFNAKHVEGMPELRTDLKLKHEKEIKLNTFINKAITEMGVGLILDGSLACYRPSTDTIEMPRMDAFVDQTAYDMTLLHESLHATMKEGRYPRKNPVSFDMKSSDYAIEELRAEIASWFMGMELELPFDESHFSRHKSYIQSWSQHINQDLKILFEAIKDADKMADYLAKVGGLELIKEHEMDVVVEELE